MPRYGLPPPPVPRMPAPMAIRSMSWWVRVQGMLVRPGLHDSQVAGGADADLGGTAGQVAHRHFLNIDNLDRVRVDSGADGLVDCHLSGDVQCFGSGVLVQREYALHFATALGNRGTDRVRDVVMVWPS